MNTTLNLISCGFLHLNDPVMQPLGDQGETFSQGRYRQRETVNRNNSAVTGEQSCGYQQRQEYNEVSITFMYQGARSGD